MCVHVYMLVCMCVSGTKRAWHEPKREVAAIMNTVKTGTVSTHYCVFSRFSAPARTFHVCSLEYVPSSYYLPVDSLHVHAS